jgi:hypothetical protein
VDLTQGQSSHSSSSGSSSSVPLGILLAAIIVGVVCLVLILYVCKQRHARQTKQRAEQIADFFSSTDETSVGVSIAPGVGPGVDVTIHNFATSATADASTVSDAVSEEERAKAEMKRRAIEEPADEPQRPRSSRSSREGAASIDGASSSQHGAISTSTSAGGDGGLPDESTITVAELEEATDGFAAACELGRGGFGTVYAASTLKMPSLKAVPILCAVKRLSADSDQGQRELETEVRVLTRHKHENLLPLLGFCLDARAPCLVYPLMEGGNLEDRLLLTPEALRRLSVLRAHGNMSQPKALTWKERMRILRDGMRGLVFLHTATSSRAMLMHRDVKPTNIRASTASRPRVPREHVMC